VAPILMASRPKWLDCSRAGKTAVSSCSICSVENPWSVVFHEYAHRLMDGNLTVRTDPWFEEGFAEFFRVLKWTTKKPASARFRTRLIKYCSSLEW